MIQRSAAAGTLVSSPIYLLTHGCAPLGFQVAPEAPFFLRNSRRNQAHRLAIEPLYFTLTWIG
jgi:hypothetical protein